MIMHLIATGEGPTDIGSSNNGEGISEGNNFQHGPMFKLLLKQLDELIPEWNKDQVISHTFVYRKDLGLRSKASTSRIPSKDRAAKGHLEHAKRAAALAEYAKERFPDSWENSVSIYFHDCDGTRSELDREPAMQENRVTAIISGFKAAGYATGIAMIPKPTSEAWLICSIKDSPYSHCGNLETDLSGNDRSADRAPKMVLANAINNHDYHREDLNYLVEGMDICRVDMPSFNQFKNDLSTAIEIICGEVRS